MPIYPTVSDYIAAQNHSAQALPTQNPSRISKDRLTHWHGAEKESFRPMDFTGKRIRGFVYASANAIDTGEDIEAWIDKALQFNPMAKDSKKKPKKT